MSTDSIGSAGGRDYANPADWWAGIPTTLLENEIGDLYNDSEFVITSQLLFNGKTTGAFNITLRTAMGQGFKDSQNAPGFKLQYDVTQGVGIRSTTEYMTPGLRSDNGTAVTIDGIQLKTTAANSYPLWITDGTFKNSIIDGNGNIADRPNAKITNADCINVLSIYRNTAVAGIGFSVEYGGLCINITSVRPSGSAASGSGYTEAGGITNIVINCCSFNFATDFSAGWEASSNYNASDSTGSPGGNAVDSLTYADQFTGTADNWKLKAGSGMIGTGLTNALATTDILGNTRGAAGGASDIGCCEFISAVVQTAIPIRTLLGVGR